jgi:hypothetical protein
MIDPTVKRRMKNSFWVFDIMLTIPNSLSSVECVGYSIEKALGSVGRRTHIFVNIDNPTLLDGVAIIVIKEQYCYQDHRFNETEVLRHVHAGRNPRSCSVHMAHSEDVKRPDGTSVCSGNRYKKRIGLVEYGKPFMDLKTPLEVLKAIFDLLESESEFDMVVFHLTFFGENSYATLVFQAQCSTSRHKLRKLTVYGERSLYCHSINTVFLLSSIYWIRRKSSSIHRKGSSVSVSMAPSATVNL